MQAIRMHRFGAPDVLVLEELPTPTAGPGQVLIKVEAAAVNYADLMRRRNDPYPFPTNLPFTPGGEVAGSVAALGAGVAGPPVGTPVFALVGNDGSNGYAQYAVANAPQVIPIPPGLSTEVASALVVAGATAMLTLQQAAQLQPGERVLVQAAAGGVGSYALQLARRLGAGMVIAAASTAEKRAHALGLGADHVIDYTQPDWPAQVRALTDGQGADVILEMSGGPQLEQSLSCLAPFGRLVVYGMASREVAPLGAPALHKLLYVPAPNQALVGFNVGLWFALRPQQAAAALGMLIGLVAAGEVQVPVSAVLPLAEAAEAHRLIERRAALGKVILKPWA